MAVSISQQHGRTWAGQGSTWVTNGCSMGFPQGIVAWHWQRRVVDVLGKELVAVADRGADLYCRLASCKVWCDKTSCHARGPGLGSSLGHACVLAGAVGLVWCGRVL